VDVNSAADVLEVRGVSIFHPEHSAAEITAIVKALA
jgi:hypothetical protein